MGIIATYDGKIFHNPSNKFCIVIVKTADTSVPEQARDKRRYKDHLIRFTAVGYEIPMTRYFYEYQPPEPVEDIVERITALEADIAASLKALFHEEGK